MMWVDTDLSGSLSDVHNLKLQVENEMEMN